MTEISASISASISFLREQLDALDRQREALDLQRVRLTEALEVLDRDVVSPALLLAGRGPAPVVAGGTPPEERPTLAMRILDVLRSSGPLNRRQLLQAFAGTGVKPGTLDSAVHRLVRRRLVDKRGAGFAVVEPQQPSVAGHDGEVAGSRSAVPPSRSDGSSGPVDASVEQDRVHTGGEVDVVSGADMGAPSAVADRVPDADDARPLTPRVHDAVASGIAGTRSALLRHFAAQGVPATKVDSALSGLRRRRKLKSVGGGVIAVVGSDEPSAPANAGSPGS